MKPLPLPKFPPWPASAPVSLARYRRRRWWASVVLGFLTGFGCGLIATAAWTYYELLRRGIGV